MMKIKSENNEKLKRYITGDNFALRSTFLTKDVNFIALTTGELIVKFSPTTSKIVWFNDEYKFHHTFYVNEIEKWAYASDANATDVGDILFVRANVGAASSQSYGYCMGGKNPPYNNIEKYSFTTDGNSTDVGDLTATKGSTCGTQI